MDRTNHVLLMAPTFFIGLVLVSSATAQVTIQPANTVPQPVVSAEEMVVQSAGMVLNQAMQSPGNRIPESMLSDAYGVAIIPNVIKGSFIVGARRGRGLLFVREPDGVWHAPVFITLTGGNIGWQIGVQSSDIILVFKTQRSIQGLLSGKLTIGADAAAAAGPVGRETAVATDGRLQAEIYTYSRSRGLFAGVSIDGSVVQVDQFATGAYYPSAVPGGPVTVPPSAGQLTMAVATYAGHAQPDAPVNQNAAIVQQQSARETDVLRAQIVQLSPKLFALLDDQWTSYLGIPIEMLRGTDPSPETLLATIARFDEVSRNPQYAQLAARPEFQSLNGLLHHYQQALSPSAPELRLPPPPK
ncbi:lipid-binding SYLF domain-containing protein [Rubripirellula reticaptiva]|uniref:Ysc84 actin-binding domain-containing protein n=1 Tax=Rubripirellula reticaptiva TaxID=2528013 RepID=A0A5C6EHS9_9BACT|nr:lipid-binding SYLF domain-containing protein [Rubripirellula reticaptiva]TWU48025.1 hypothetical protein Poly59_48690 [Rubripirellula reticaptiva]